ncbi:MAG TPA: RluA family pseudouridine synthase [Candidatus Saccharimonadales bacterium]|nr:RluA family pseudouridine synthase [Candidatus Saccharimonadales bacterium]
MELSRAERLDQYVVRYQPLLSRSGAVRLIEAGGVLVNGQAQVKAGYKVRETDAIVINFDEKQHAEIPEIELPVIFENKDVVVINKPAGILTHSKGGFNPEATVATWLRSRLAKGYDPGDNQRAGIVHRLDRATSGVMICAKTPEALSWLQKQFSQRKVKKTYQAVVNGQPSPAQAVIDMPIERNPRKPQTFRVGPNGKTAQTAYRVIAHGDHNSLVELKPQTGRTHQLRVHLSQLGYPIVGDVLYGGPEADRLYLHAESLELTLPNRDRKVFTAPTPVIFQERVQ